MSIIQTKILISYIVICLTYSLCRLHYLMTQKSDEEFNSMLEELLSVAGTKDVIKLLVLLQIALSPITAPFSIMKQVLKMIKNLILKKY